MGPSPSRWDEAQSPTRSSRSRPWRKSKAECMAEDAQAQSILALSSEAAEGVGVDPGTLLFCLSAQECLDAPPPPPACGRRALARKQATASLPSSEELQSTCSSGDGDAPSTCSPTFAASRDAGGPDAFAAAQAAVDAF